MSNDHDPVVGAEELRARPLVCERIPLLQLAVGVVAVESPIIIGVSMAMGVPNNG